MKTVKFFRLDREIKLIGKEIQKAVSKVLDSGIYVDGPQTKEFEEKWAEYTGVKYCALVGSGTVGLQLALLAAGLQGERVLTTPLSFIATTNAISHANGEPLFVDVGDDAQISIKEVEKTLEVYEKGSLFKIKALLPVSLYGNPCNLLELNRLAKKYNIPLICDSAQSHGSKIQEVPCSQFGLAHIYSHYISKNYAGVTEGGSVVTNDENLHKEIVCLRNHGRTINGYVHEKIGYNGRGSEINASVLLVKLKYLDSWNARRNDIANKYKKNLTGLKMLNPNPYNYCVWHLFPVWVPHRDKVREKLKEKGVETGCHYNKIIPDQPCYDDGTPDLTLNTARTLADEVITLPMYPTLKDSEITYVCDRLLETLNETGN